MKYILKIVWDYCPAYFIIPLMYFVVLGFLLIKSLEFNMLSTGAEIGGFVVAFLLFFPIMVIAPIAGAYSLALGGKG